MTSYVNRRLRRLVRRRSAIRCEYCRRPESDGFRHFQVDHVIGEQHGGPTVAENLALACMECNQSKEPNVATFDPETGALVPLFHPRTQRWDEHFAVRGSRIVGRTPIGRGTVRLLKMNDPGRLFDPGTLAGA